MSPFHDVTISTLLLTLAFVTKLHDRKSHYSGISRLAHWGRVTHTCASKLAIVGSDNGLSPGRRQAIIWTNDGILLIGPLGTKFNEIIIEICIFSFKIMYLKMSSGKWRSFCLGLSVLRVQGWWDIFRLASFIRRVAPSGITDSPNYLDRYCVPLLNMTAISCDTDTTLVQLLTQSNLAIAMCIWVNIR